MSTDYTLPPVPRTLQSAGYMTTAISYGHACAEHVRAPLLAEIDRLRAEVEALTAANTAMLESMCIARDIAMEFTARARIPECGEFGKIAQELDASIAAHEQAPLANRGEGGG